MNRHRQAPTTRFEIFVADKRECTPKRFHKSTSIACCGNPTGARAHIRCGIEIIMRWEAAIRFTRVPILQTSLVAASHKIKPSLLRRLSSEFCSTWSQQIDLQCEWRRTKRRRNIQNESHRDMGVPLELWLSNGEILAYSEVPNSNAMILIYLVHLLSIKTLCNRPLVRHRWSSGRLK